MLEGENNLLANKVKRYTAGDSFYGIDAHMFVIWNFPVIGLVSAYARILQFQPIILHIRNIMHPLLNLQPIF